MESRQKSSRDTNHLEGSFETGRIRNNPFSGRINHFCDCASGNIFAILVVYVEYSTPHHCRHPSVLLFELGTLYFKSFICNRAHISMEICSRPRLDGDVDVRDPSFKGHVL